MMRLPECFGLVSDSDDWGGSSGSMGWIAASSSACDVSSGTSSALMGVVGREGGGASERGGGGMGALFASPIRRRVIVNCAFVGTPRRMVLMLMTSEKGEGAFLIRGVSAIQGKCG